MKHVAVLMGGWSAERPVSLNSGRGCADALEARGYRVTRVDVDRDIAATLAKLKPDVAFNALHGRVGEDGTIQGVLEILRIPYTHSGVLASALAMQKDLAKIVLQAAGVPVADGVTVDRREAARRHVLEPPYVLKPVNEGSSFGVVIVKKDRAAPAPGGRPRGLALWRPPARRALRRRQGTDLRRDGRPGRSTSSKSSRSRKPSTAMTQNMRRAARFTSFRRELNRKFTMKSKS